MLSCLRAVQTNILVQLHYFNAVRITVSTVSVVDFSAQALLYAWKHTDEIADYLKAIASADGVIVATPVYKAAYSGALKLLLDLLPERAFTGKVILPIAVGGSAAHMLALDYALRPVLGALKPKVLVDGTYAVDEQIAYQPDGSVLLDDDLQHRLSYSLDRFIEQLPRPPYKTHDSAALSEKVVAAQLGI
jgi:FMN reductase